MTKRELIKFLKEEIPKLPTNYDKVYDAVTIDEGITECCQVGRRWGYEYILWLLTNGKEKMNDKDIS